MKIAVVTYPGSHCAEDTVYALSSVVGHDAYSVWHDQDSLNKPDAVVIPGGASFSDYLRPGALAKTSRISARLRRFAAEGGPMLGIGNGFQILCELEILPGVVLVNPDLRFCSTEAYVSVESQASPFSQHLEMGTVLRMPVACHYGCYFGDSRVYKDLEEGDHIIFRYCDRHGDTSSENTLNGSMDCIAAISSRHKNVVGMLPHPERAAEEIMGNLDGAAMLKTITPYFEK